MITKKCVTCKKEFQSIRNNALYCSNYCRVKACRLKLSKSRNKKSLPSNETIKKIKKYTKEKPANFQEPLVLLNEVISKLDQILITQNKIVLQRDQYLVPSQACNLLSINRSTFDRFAQVGIFKIYRLGKGKVYVKRSEIDQLFVAQ